MSWIHSAYRATAVGAFVAIVLIPLSSITALADANPNNHGHHYGQLKHRHPAPQPTPSAFRPTAPPIVTHLVGTVARGAGSVPGSGAAQIAAPGDTGLVHVAAGSINLARTSAQPDPDWWLVLAFAVTLIALWLWVLASLARSLLRRRHARVLAAAAA